MCVPDEGYTRHVSCTLHLFYISTFLFKLTLFRRNSSITIIVPSSHPEFTSVFVVFFFNQYQYVYYTLLKLKSLITEDVTTYHSRLFFSFFFKKLGIFRIFFYNTITFHYKKKIQSNHVELEHREKQIV